MIGVFLLEVKANYSPSIVEGIYFGTPTIKMTQTLPSESLANHCFS